MTKILGLIPARGGSKRLPRKNIKDFLGRPLISWTIEQAKKSRLLDKIMVSTDDEEIAEVARKYGADVPFLRPGELARDSSPTIDAVIHALDRFEESGEHFDIVALLEPTSPLRTDSDIDTAIELLLANLDKAESLVSVGEVHLEKPQILRKIDAGYVRPFIENGECIAMQAQEKAYFPYGVIYIATAKSLRTYRTFYQEKTIPYFIGRWQNYEIDDALDRICCESVQRFRSEAKEAYLDMV